MPDIHSDFYRKNSNLEQQNPNMHFGTERKLELCPEISQFYSCEDE